MRQRKNSLLGLGAIIVFASFLLITSMPLTVMADNPDWPTPPDNNTDTLADSTSNPGSSDPIDPDATTEDGIISTITEIITDIF